MKFILGQTLACADSKDFNLITMRKKTYLFICLAVIQFATYGQYLTNPSFEGPAGIGLTPPGWESFDSNSTPDTEPVLPTSLQASDGATYTILVSRGSTSSMPNTFENFQTELQAPLEAGNCYDLSIDISTRSDLSMCTVNGYIDYSETPLLNIYGNGSRDTKGTLIASSEEVHNMDSWQTFYFRIIPDSDISFMTFEIALPNHQNGFGNIALDNLVLEHVENDTTLRMNADFTNDQLPIELLAGFGDTYSWVPSEGLTCSDCRAPELTEEISGTYVCTISDTYGCKSTELFIINFLEEPIDEMKIPNVFTPNNDGINDYFKILGLPPYSSLLIFDGDGRQVYINDNYDNSWDGRGLNDQLLPKGTYWYILVTPGFGGKKKGYVYLKR